MATCSNGYLYHLNVVCVARDGVQLRSGVQVCIGCCTLMICALSVTLSLGSQRMLNVLSSYSREKQLEVNTDKLQIMVFNTLQLDFAFDYTDILMEESTDYLLLVNSNI